MGDRAGEGGSYFGLGIAFEYLGYVQQAIDFYQSSVKAFDITRALLVTKDAWKISFRDLYQKAYPVLWRTVVNDKQTDEALRAAEQGREQALNVGLKVKYGLALLPFESLKSKETISYISREVSAQTVFLALHENTVNIWLLSKGIELFFDKFKFKVEVRLTIPLFSLWKQL